MGVTAKFESLEDFVTVVTDIYNTLSVDVGYKGQKTAEEVNSDYIANCLMTDKLKDDTIKAVSEKTTKEDFKGENKDNPLFIIAAFEEAYGKGSVDEIIRGTYNNILYSPAILTYEIPGETMNIKLIISTKKSNKIFKIKTKNELGHIHEETIKETIEKYQKSKEKK
ncbi:MAG: hypothetical protein ABIB43_03520 [archaeon]